MRLNEFGVLLTISVAPGGDVTNTSNHSSTAEDTFFGNAEKPLVTDVRCYECVFAAWDVWVTWM
jgi:hypothetical protein